MTGRPIDLLLHHMPTVVREAETDWARNFAKSILKQSRRPGWKPSLKQRQIMEGMVDELFAASEDVLDDAECAPWR